MMIFILFDVMWREEVERLLRSWVYGIVEISVEMSRFLGGLVYGERGWTQILEHSALIFLLVVSNYLAIVDGIARDQTFK